MDHRLEARDRLRQLPAQQRATWLDIAEHEFRTFGFAGASLNRIFARAGISKGQAYYYFTSKGELYRATIERALAELAVLIEARPIKPHSPADYWEHIAALTANVTKVLGENDLLAELGRGVYREAAAQEAIQDLLEDLHARFRQVVEVGQSVGAVRRDLPLALLTDMAFAALREADRWFALNAHDLDPDDGLALNQRVFSLLVAMLSPADGEPETRKPPKD